jgi:hypothetical protein
LIKWLLFLAVSTYLSCFGRAQAAEIRAKSVSLTDVTSAVGAAKDGDTVIVPAGTASWTAPLEITNNITLQGTGAESTIVISEVPRGSRGQAGAPRNQFVRPSKMGGARSPAGSRQRFLIGVNLMRDRPFRLTGFTFKGGLVNTEKTFNGEIRITGNSHSFRIDHCAFDQLHGTNVRVGGFLWGVIDHCKFNLLNAQPIRLGHETWNGGDHGNGSWADNPYWGSEKFVFIEDNVFENATGKTAIDAYEGARFVVRYNHFHNCGLSMHGTEASGRGGKQVEEYNNTYRNNNSLPAGQIRSGSVITHDNTWSKVNRGHVLQAYRLFGYPQHWGYCNGQNPYDDNAPSGRTGYWETGKHTGPNGATVLTDSTKHWTTNQWYEPGVVYISRNKTLEAAASENIDKVPAFIVSNTADTVTCSSLTHNAVAFRHIAKQLTFNTGDTYEIWKVIHTLDQPGLGKGDLMRGVPGLPANWPHQIAEPCYSWNNTQNGAAVNLASTEPCIKDGRDFFNGVPKPDYKPYVYPHPLVTGSSRHASQAMQGRDSTGQ